MADQKCLEKGREWFSLEAGCWCEQEWGGQVSTGRAAGAAPGRLGKTKWSQKLLGMREDSQ